jgi:cytochrome c oxidase subunit I
MFNWLATMWRGRIRLTTAMLFALGFLSAFLIGGLDGAFLAAAPFDFHVQDTYWIVSHLHYVLLGGSAFGIFAATYYWFPKIFGARLNESLGKIHWVLFFVGQNLAFFPQHFLGLAGMPRRIQDYSPDAGWTTWNFVSSVGALMVGVSMLPFLWNLFLTLRGPKTHEDDPWDANTLEWATTSPPPPWNFDALPPVRSERPLFDLKYGHLPEAVTERRHQRAEMDPYESTPDKAKLDAPPGPPPSSESEPEIPGGSTVESARDVEPAKKPRSRKSGGER